MKCQKTACSLRQLSRNCKSAAVREREQLMQSGDSQVSPDLGKIGNAKECPVKATKNCLDVIFCTDDALSHEKAHFHVILPILVGLDQSVMIIIIFGSCIMHPLLIRISGDFYAQ